MVETVTIGDATLYLGDCLEILPALGRVDAVVTDPVWPNAPKNSVPGSDDPSGLFAAAAPFLRQATRIVVQLGCDSDPAMLRPLDMTFLRVCWLEYARPSYKGRLLNTGDVAYCYGDWPPARPGMMVLPGRIISGRIDREFIRGWGRNGKRLGGHKLLPHPMPRRLEIVSWLVSRWVVDGECCLDPFMGSGTTGVACAKLGRKFIGIEIEPKYFDIACKRIEKAHAQGDLFIAPAKKAEQTKMDWAAPHG